MKGMRQIKRGSSFGGVSSYVINRDEDKEKGEIIGGNMTGTTPDELTQEFEIVRSLRPEIKKPVWHNSLRLPEKEKISDEKWKEIGDDYMQKMGFSEMHPRVYVKHDDKEGQHIHIVANRIALDGQVYLGRNENLKSTKHINNLEKEHQLIRTKAPSYDNGKVVMPEVKELKKGELEMMLNKGKEPVKPPRLKLREYIDDALKEKCTAVEFCERLEVVGVKTCPNIAKTGKLNGFSFECEGIAFKGSQLGNNYKISKLQERGLDYEQARDSKGLTARKERLSRESEKDRGVDQGVAGATRSDSKRSVAPDRTGSEDQEKLGRGNGENQRIDQDTRRVTRENQRYTKGESNPKPNDKQSSKTTADNMGEIPSPSSSGSDRRELVRSWESRFRAIDSTVSSAKRQQHIQRNKEQSNEERNRPSQRNFTKKVEPQKESTRDKKIVKSSGIVIPRKKPKSLDDDYGLSM